MNGTESCDGSAAVYFENLCRQKGCSQEQIASCKSKYLEAGTELELGKAILNDSAGDIT